MTSHSLVQGRAVTIHPPDGTPPFLIVQLTIVCDICGTHETIIAGHHLRPIVALLQEFIEAEPELTAEGIVDVVSRRSSGPITPENN